MSDSTSPILHVIVVGFHHRKGAVAEFAYPPLRDAESTGSQGDDTTEISLPRQWSHLPSVAIPEGAHHVERDTIFFHLPPIDSKSNKTVYAIACYRQIDTDKLKNKSADMTRCSVQKSVCVLSSVPLYGLIKAKLELITQAYFNECDFDRRAILQEVYQSLVDNIHYDLLDSQAHLGLSARDLTLTLKHSTLMLFKAILLEKRILFHLFPVEHLCQTMLSVISLFPNMIQNGLDRATTFDEHFTRKGGGGEVAKEGLEGAEVAIEVSDQTSELTEVATKIYSQAQYVVRRMSDTLSPTATEEKVFLSPAAEEAKLAASKSMEDFQQAVDVRKTTRAELKTDEAGQPLSVFTDGVICQPYMSLISIDTLAHVRGCVVGATNDLFKHRKDLFDIVVTTVDSTQTSGRTAASPVAGRPQIKIEILDPALRRTLAFTTADLRFAEHLMQHVQEETGNVFIDGTSFEGGDEWIRQQFSAYLLSLLATARSPDVAKRAEFGTAFMHEFRRTNCMLVWAGAGILPDQVCGHPFGGSLAMNDVKTFFKHKMNESGATQAAASAEKMFSDAGKNLADQFGAYKTQWKSWLSQPKTTDMDGSAVTSPDDDVASTPPY